MRVRRASTSGGLVIAAPHDSFEFSTGDIAQLAAEVCGAGAVVARAYRVSSGERWLNVNRPTEGGPGAAGQPRERETPRAHGVFQSYLERLHLAAGASRLSFLVEVHGTRRQVQIDGRKAGVPVVEVVASGLDQAAQLRARRKLEERWSAIAGVPALDFHFLALAEAGEYFCKALGVRLPFRYQCEATRAIGSLQTAVVPKALHLELPWSVRTDATASRNFAALLGDLAAELASDP
jgi:hypothetical protein